MHTVAVAVYDRCLAFEMVVPCEVFGVDRSVMGVPNYRLLLCRVEPGPLRMQVGFSVDVPHDLAALEEADTIIVPGWRDIDECPPEPLLAALRRAHTRGARLGSLCSGAFVLAAAGLLDGRRATTHWLYASALAARFPRVQVDPDVLYVDEGGVFTAAGTAAAIDLCLHLVALDYGQAVANTFARRMVVAPHRDGGQAQYVQALGAEEPQEGSMAATMAWAVGHLHEPLTVRCLADHARLPVRTFARQFRGAIGTTPGRWLTDQRIMAARRGLETTHASIEQLAQTCGFGSAASFRLHFRRALGIAPTSYRKQFQARDETSRTKSTSLNLVR
jgi:transcriptional regulator GlxA family with amidase domain